MQVEHCKDRAQHLYESEQYKNKTRKQFSLSQKLI